MPKSSNEQQGVSNESPPSSVPGTQPYPSESSPHSPQSSSSDSYSSVDPRMLAAMYGMQQEDGIDLLEYWRLIWGKKTLILSVVFAAGILAAGISLLMPNIYRAEVLLAPVSEEGGRGGGLASALGGLSGLASLAGVALPGGGNVEENLAVLSSKEFLWKFIKDEKLMPILFDDGWDIVTKTWKEADPEDQPSYWDAYRMFINGRILSVKTDKVSGLVTVAIEWEDAELAANWANLLVNKLNEYLRQQAIAKSRENLKFLNEELLRTQVEDIRRALFDLISQEQKRTMLANTQKQFAFQVIDAAVAPDRVAKPKRSIIVVFAALVSGFFATIGVLVAGAVRKRKEEGWVSQS